MSTTGDPGPSTASSSRSLPDTANLGLLVEEPMDEETADLFMIARSHYNAKEHERVDYLLRFVTHPKARFLGLYSRFIVRGHLYCLAHGFFPHEFLSSLVRSEHTTSGCLGKVYWYI